MIILGIIIYLLIDNKKAVKFRDRMIDERDREIVKLRIQNWNLKMDLISSNTGKNFDHLKEKEEEL